MITRPEEMPVAILAGGLATRLRPITETIPKSLVTVAGRPFLSHQLDQLAGQGFGKVVLCVGHLGEMIEEMYGDGSAFGIELKYSFDGPELLGTGGALRRALHHLGEAFFVLYGDSYLPIGFPEVGKAFLESGKEGLMTVFHNEGLYDSSNVQFENGKILRYDKSSKDAEMRHIDYGLSLFKSSVFEALPAGGKSDLAQIMADLLSKQRLAAYEVTERFYEIGSHQGLEELDELLAKL